MTYLAFLALCAGFVCVLSVLALRVGRVRPAPVRCANVKPNRFFAKPSDFQ